MDLSAIKTSILSQVDLEVLIGESVTLRRQSGRLTGCCPFHQEKSPSFYVFSDHYHCFGCGAHGDAITFVREREGFGFIESLRFLGRKFGVSAPELEEDFTGRRKDEWQKSQRQTRILEEAQKFFISHLHAPNPAGAFAREYLEKRGYSLELQKKLGIGLAPDAPSQLLSFLKGQGYLETELEQASLVAKTPRGTTVDFFRNRIIVAVRDPMGKLVAFGGRALGDAPQKYKNSRYDKGSILFGFDQARQQMRLKSRAIVVEGYFDVLQLWSKGFTEAVACQGTAMTRQHFGLLKNTVSLVYLVFDGDLAGERASLKAIEESLNAPEITFKVCRLPQGQDPDAFLRQEGVEAFERFLASSIDLVSFGIKARLEGLAPSRVPQRINQEILPWIARMEDPLRKGFLLKELSLLAGLDEGDLRLSLNILLKKQQLKGPKAPLSPVSGTLRGELPLVAKDLLGHLFFARSKDEIPWESLQSFLESELELPEVWQLLLLEIMEVLQQGEVASARSISSWLASHEVEVLSFLQNLKEREKAFLCSDRKERLSQLQLFYRQNKIKGTIHVLKTELGKLQPQKPEDKQQMFLILKEIQALNQKLEPISI